MLHKPGMTGWNGLPHEKENPEAVALLRRILEPAPLSEAQQSKEFEADDETTWFGVARGPSGDVIQDHGRFATLMTESHGFYQGERYPQLVSFVGQTGINSLPYSTHCKVRT
jgi:hypothetical protein